jgi:7,8-dihydropterin-6-yl-methyl-4-(beta-D-ribofuranosyl)aminobenzene 5'-phosphate synthase
LTSNYAERVTITIVDDNSIDFLLADSQDATRYDLPTQFDSKRSPVQAEFGISFLVEVERANRVTRLLFDAGFTPDVLKHNLRVLEIDPSYLDHIVISHGHPDHYGGLPAVLAAVERPLPVSTHPDAFEPRYAVMPNGAVAPFYNSRLDRRQLEEAGARFVLAKSPVEIIPGVITSGEIERRSSFEGPREPTGFAGLFQVKDGVCGLDHVWDEMALIINVRDAGLVVLTGCGHAGVINSLSQAVRLTGIDRIAAVMGGFHLGFPGTPSDNIKLTVESLRDLDVGRVVPMHCTGLAASSSMMQNLPDAYLQPSVGTRFVFGNNGA